MDTKHPDILNQLNETGDRLDSAEWQRFVDQLSDLCEGNLDANQMRELEPLLRESPEARSTYLQYLYMHANLGYSQPQTASSREFQGLPAAPVGAEDSVIHRFVTLLHRRQSWVLRGSLAAVVFLAGLFVFFSRSSAPAPLSRSRVHYVAQVVREEGCRWEGNARPNEQGGMLLCEDPLQLAEGLAMLRFDCGAEVILRGPAQLRIHSGSRCTLSEGELSARVPEVAHGFTVDTPLGRVVDLGTEFGVRVDDAIEIQVFEGACELHPEPNSVRQKSKKPEDSVIGLPAGSARKITLDEKDQVVRVVDLPKPTHQFARALPDRDNHQATLGVPPLAVDSFGQGEPGTRMVGRNGGFGWQGPWLSTPDSNSVSFLLGSQGAISRGSGSGVVERRLSSVLTAARQLYFSAEIRIDGPDPRCSAWLALFKFKPNYWSNGDTDLAVIGITDGQFSGRLAPFGEQKLEQALGDCGNYVSGSRHLIVGRLEFDAVGDQERLSVWINPSLGDEMTPDKTLLRETGQPGADAVAIRCWEMDDETIATFDELRVGIHWLDVVQ